VAEAPEAGTPVGWGQVGHLWWAYHPRRYLLRLEVDPAWQGRGVGSRLYERLVEQELRGWQPEVVRAQTRANRDAALRFLEHRGFVEWHRRWESILEVATARTEPLLAADRRVAQDGFLMTTYQHERARRGNGLDQTLYELEALINRDEPGMDEDAEPLSFERFCATELHPPGALPAANFLALAGEQIVALSRLERDQAHPDVLHQSFTGTHPAYRGRGLAQALKLRTIAFAREQGYRQIHTSNESTNAPMLHINELIGFQRQVPTIVFEKRF